MQSEGSPTQKSTCFDLYEVLGEAKLICIGKTQKNDCRGSGIDWEVT